MLPSKRVLLVRSFELCFTLALKLALLLFFLDLVESIFCMVYLAALISVILLLVRLTEMSSLRHGVMAGEFC